MRTLNRKIGYNQYGNIKAFNIFVNVEDCGGYLEDMSDPHMSGLDKNKQFIV